MAHQDTTPAKPAHTESHGAPAGRFADDATGINVADRKPIDPRMPNMPPA
jgi:hypothetical protein